MNEELKYSCQINADKFIATENEYYETIKKIADFKKIKSDENSLFNLFRPALIWAGKSLCLLGIMLAILVLLPFGICSTNYFMTVSLLIFFIVTFLLFKNERKISVMMWEKINKLVSESRTEHTFKIARRLVPFTANYHLIGNTITYSRTKEGNEAINWSKTIENEFYTGRNFVITYKKRSLFPHLFIFADSTGEIISYLNNLGMTQISYPDTTEIARYKKEGN